MRLVCRPTISQARAIHSSLPEVRAVIVLAFTDDDVAGASYGDTKTECNQIGYTMDKIIEAICDGRIPVWLEGADMGYRPQKKRHDH
jgi:hypothetical protein